MSRGFLLLIFFAPAVLGRDDGTNDISSHTNEVTEGDLVDIKYAPKFKHPSKMYIADIRPAGSSVRYKCVSEGNPTPNVTWNKNGGPIIRTNYNSPPYYGKWSMTLEEVTKADDGNYTCVVCNEFGCISHNVELHVQERLYTRPIMTVGLQNITASCKETVNLSCQFLSDMHMIINWTWRSPNATEEQVIVSDNLNDKPDKFTIYNVTSNSEGWYKCMAVNALGSASSQGYLAVINSNNLFTNADNTLCLDESKQRKKA